VTVHGVQEVKKFVSEEWDSKNVIIACRLQMKVLWENRPISIPRISET